MMCLSGSVLYRLVCYVPSCANVMIHIHTAYIIWICSVSSDVQYSLKDNCCRNRDLAVLVYPTPAKRRAPPLAANNAMPCHAQGGVLFFNVIFDVLFYRAKFGQVIFQSSKFSSKYGEDWVNFGVTPSQKN